MDKQLAKPSLIGAIVSTMTLIGFVVVYPILLE
jgi:hypothetical protein